MVIGRDPACDISVPVVSMSRRHTRIVRIDDQFYIEDLDTLGGTWVNRQRIKGRTVLHDGDWIMLAGMRAVFRS